MDSAREALNAPSVEMNQLSSQSKADASTDLSQLPSTRSSLSSKGNIWHKIYHYDWLWECLCWLLGAAALAALAGIIANARNKSAATWRHQHANLSINAVVAVLSAVLKGTCMLIVAEGILKSVASCSILALTMRSDRRDEVVLVSKSSSTQGFRAHRRCEQRAVWFCKADLPASCAVRPSIYMILSGVAHTLLASWHSLGGS